MPMIFSWIVEWFDRWFEIPTCECNKPECGGGCWGNVKGE